MEFRANNALQRAHYIARGKSYRCISLFVVLHLLFGRYILRFDRRSFQHKANCESYERSWPALGYRLDSFPFHSIHD